MRPQLVYWNVETGFAAYKVCGLWVRCQDSFDSMIICIRQNGQRLFVPEDVSSCAVFGRDTTQSSKTFNSSPTDRAGIAGIGSLWHMGLKFANAWDCEVKAFTSSESKAEEADVA